VKLWFKCFSDTAGFAWQSAFLSPMELGRMGAALKSMGDVHVKLGWGKVMWSHFWIDHMFAYASTWRILSIFSCFKLEGSHRRLKGLLKLSSGTGGVWGVTGMVTVVNRHTMDDSLAGEGYNVQERALRKQTMPQHGRRVRRRLN
jgi:hypothetical protein